MKRALLALLLAVSALVHADESWLGMYIQGIKVGYATYGLRDAEFEGKPARRSDSRTVMSAGLLGQAMSLRMESTSWTSLSGAPLAMRFATSSAGRTQIVDARFDGATITVDVDNSGIKSKKVLTVPAGGKVVDDPLPAMLERGVTGASTEFYVFDPTTVSLVKNTATHKGTEEVVVKGVKVSAIRMDIADPRAVMRTYLTSKGDLVKMEGPMGIELLPETREEATKEVAAGYLPSTDLAYSTRLTPDKPLPNPSKLTLLKLRLTGADLSAIPSDAHQTVRRDGDSWIVEVHPPKAANSTGTIAAAAKTQLDWTRPGLHTPSDSETFRDLSRKVVGNRPRVVEAAWTIQKYVAEIMRPDAGIGVLRDATEVLKSREGVCRDYAILTATLMRAAGIPCRLASGLVSWDGLFYYHAWVEVWDGNSWFGIDSTTEEPQISAAHVKLAQGAVEDAFMFTFLDKVRVEVLEAKGREGNCET